MYQQISVALLVIILWLWIRWRKKKLQLFEKLGIPGPKPNVICGNMFEFYRKGHLECCKQWSQKYGKVYGYYFGFRPMLYVADTELLKKIQIKDFQLFIDRPSLFVDRNRSSSSFIGNSLLNAQSKRWKEVRSILTPSFTTARMKMMAPMMNDVVTMLISNIEEKAEIGEYFDIFDAYQKFTLDTIGRAAFGITTDVQKEPDNRMLRLGRILFSGKFRSLLLLLGASVPEFRNIVFYLSRLRGTLLNKGSSPVFEIEELVKSVIEQRRKNPELRRPDLLQLMLDAEGTEDDSKTDNVIQLTAGDENEKSDEHFDENEENANHDRGLKKSLKRLNDSEVLANSVVFFLAGYETTSNLLAYSTYLMAKHPEVQERVRAEVLELLEKEGELNYTSVSHLKFLDQVISEALRLYPPIVFFVMREAVVDVTYGDLRIPQGMAIQIPTYDLHHDPDHWEDPEEFKPERFSPENRSKINQMAYQPFGAGPRNCIGMRFAQMEAKIALANLLKNYDIQPSPLYDKESLKLRLSVANLTPAEGVYVRAAKRS